MSELQVGGANEDDDTHHHALFFWGALDTWDVRFSPLPHFSNFVAGDWLSDVSVNQVSRQGVAVCSSASSLMRRWV